MRKYNCASPMRLHLLSTTLAMVALPLYQAAAQNPSRTLSPLQQSRAEYLLDARLPCRGCHVIAGNGGRVGPVLDGVTARRSLDYVGNIIKDPQAVAPGTPMPRVQMNERDRALIIAYLTSRPAAAQSGPAAVRRTNLRSTTELYAHYCAACHGAGGKGDGPNAPNLPVKPANHADAKAMAARTDDRLFDGIHAGGIALGKSPLMPGFGQTLSREQIDALVKHIRTLCKCRQPKWANE